MTIQSWDEADFAQPSELKDMEHRVASLVEASRGLAKALDLVFIDDAGYSKELPFGLVRQALIGEGESMNIRRMDCLCALHEAMREWRLAVAAECAQEVFPAQSVHIELFKGLSF